MDRNTTYLYTLYTLLEETTDNIFIKDMNLVYVGCSKTFLKLIGKSKQQEIVGKTDFDIFDFALASRYTDDDKRLIATEQSLINYTEPIPSIDGVNRYSSTSKYLVRDEMGEIIGLCGISRDITAEIAREREKSRKLKENIKLYNAIMNTVYGGVSAYHFVDGRCQLLFANNQYYSIFGYEEKQEMMINQDFLNLIVSENRENVKELFKNCKNEGDSFSSEFKAFKNNGSIIYLRCHAKCIELDSYENHIILTEFTDITNIDQNKLKIKELLGDLELERNETRLLQGILDFVSIGITLYKMSPNDKIVPIYGNLEQYKMLKIDRAERHNNSIKRVGLEGKYFNDFYAGIHPDDVERVKKICEEGYLSRQFEIKAYRMLCGDGDYLFVDSNFVLCDESVGSKIFYATNVDVTKEQHLESALKQANKVERTLKYQAERDLATGLYNKVVTEVNIKKAFNNGDKNGVLLIIDIDDLKLINDQLGHMEGDKAIRQISKCIQKIFSGNAIIGRVGGDEFMVFLSQIIDKQSIYDAVNTLISEVSNSKIGKLSDRDIDCSVGIALQNEESTFESLYLEADSALYFAKTHGKKRFYVFEKNMQSVTDYKKDEIS